MNKLPNASFFVALFTIAFFSQALAQASQAKTQALKFRQACDAGENYTIAAMGDLIPHAALVNSVMANGRGFGAVWASLEKFIQGADISYVNLEGPVAPKLSTTGAQFSFNFPARVVADLKASGFDVVSTANNHSLDRGSDGANQTVDYLSQQRLAFTGTRAKGSDAAWHSITQARGLKLAWLACTYGTNGIPDSHRQVLDCEKDLSKMQTLIQDLVARKVSDAVIVTPHWGEEGSASPSATQKRQARAFLESGAVAVIGSHPHVLQRWEKMDIRGEERLVVYSLGNFVSNQLYYGDAQRTSIVLFLGLTKDRNGKVFVNGVRHLPIYMKRDPYEIRPLDSYRGVEGAWRNVRAQFAAENEIRSSERAVDTRPECR